MGFPIKKNGAHYSSAQTGTTISTKQGSPIVSAKIPEAIPSPNGSKDNYRPGSMLASLATQYTTKSPTEFLKTFTSFNPKIIKITRPHLPPPVPFLAMPIEPLPQHAPVSDTFSETTVDYFRFKIPAAAYHDWSQFTGEIRLLGQTYQKSLLDIVKVKKPSLSDADAGIWLDAAATAIQLRYERDGLGRPSVREAAMIIVDMVNTGELKVGAQPGMAERTGEVVDFNIW